MSVAAVRLIFCWVFISFCVCSVLNNDFLAFLTLMAGVSSDPSAFLGNTEMNRASRRIAWPIWSFRCHLKRSSRLHMLLQEHPLFNLVVGFNLRFYDRDVVLAIKFVRSYWISLFLFVQLGARQRSFRYRLSRRTRFPDKAIGFTCSVKIFFRFPRTFRFRLALV